MSTAMAQVTARRVWFVPQFQVWGQSGLGDVNYLLLEQSGSTKQLFFCKQTLGQPAQAVRYDELTDHRGNMLPGQIEGARVIVRNRSNRLAWIVGNETGESFRIARDMSGSEPATVDLFVIEMGQ